MAKRRTAAQKRATARLVALNKSRRAAPKRRRNPVSAVARAANPVKRRIARVTRAARRAVKRRRNPISMGSASSYVNLIKDGVIGGAGAVAMDLAFGQVNRFLPATLQRVPGQVGMGDAVKAVLTVALGKLLNKPTRGLSMTAAKGSLTVQAHGLISQFVPATMPLGYAVPSNVVNMSNRIGPNRMAPSGNVARFVRPGASPLLSAYTAPGSASPLLSGRNLTMQREAVVR